MTKFKQDGYGGSEVPICIRDAVIQNITRWQGSGQVESLSNNATETISALGSLVQKLHEKGVLNDEDIRELIGNDWNPVEEPDEGQHETTAVPLPEAFRRDQ